MVLWYIYMYKTASGHQRRSLHLPYTLCRQEKNHSSGTTNRRFAGRAEIAELMMPQQALPRKFLKQKKTFFVSCLSRKFKYVILKVHLWN